MDYTKITGPRNYMIMKHLIDAQMASINWETDPRWEEDMGEAILMMKHFWKHILERK